MYSEQGVIMIYVRRGAAAHAASCLTLRVYRHLRQLISLMFLSNLTKLMSI